MKTLKELRLKSGLKASKIADELNISRVHLYNLENKKYKITEDKLNKLEKLYGVDLKRSEKTYD